MGSQNWWGLEIPNKTLWKQSSVHLLFGGSQLIIRDVYNSHKIRWTGIFSIIFPALTIKINHLWVDIPYMDPMGLQIVQKFKFQRWDPRRIHACPFWNSSHHEGFCFSSNQLEAFPFGSTPPPQDSSHHQDLHAFATRFPRLRQSSIRFRLNQSHNPWIWFKPAANKEDVISKGTSLNINFDANWDVFWSRKHMFHCSVSWCANGANRLSPCCLSSWYAHPTYTSYNTLYSSWETKGAPPMPTPQEIRPY